MRVEKEKRTIPQNSSIHLWCEQIAQVLIERGMTMTEVIKQMSERGVEIYPTKYSVKEGIVKPIMGKMWGKSSSKELLKLAEIDKMVDVITKFFGNIGVEIPPFPSREEDDLNL